MTAETKAQLDALSEALDATMTDVLVWVIASFAKAASQSPSGSTFAVFRVPDETKAQIDALFKAHGMSRMDVFVQAIAAFAKAHAPANGGMTGTASRTEQWSAGHDPGSL